MRLKIVLSLMCLTTAVQLMASSLTFGHGMIPQDVPVERLVANLSKYIKEHPKDAEAYYRLGRVHTLALETKSEFVLAFPANRSGPPKARGRIAACRATGRTRKSRTSS